MTATGIDGAVRAAGAGSQLRELVEGPENAELFADIEAGERAMVGETTWSRRGRKPGAKNLTTQRVLDYIRQFSRDPLVSMATLASLGPKEFADAVGLKASSKEERVASARLQQAVRAEFAPYLHSRQPLALAASISQPTAPGEDWRAIARGFAAAEEDRRVIRERVARNNQALDRIANGDGPTAEGARDAAKRSRKNLLIVVGGITMATLVAAAQVDDGLAAISKLLDWLRTNSDAIMAFARTCGDAVLRVFEWIYRHLPK